MAVAGKDSPVGLKINLKPPGWLSKLRITIKPRDAVLAARIATGTVTPTEIAAKALELAIPSTRQPAGILLPDGQKGIPMLSILKTVASVVAMLIALVQVVEVPGHGEEKKGLVVDAFKQVLLELTLPKWLAAIFSSDKIVGILVDLIVWACNKIELFGGDDEIVVNPQPAGIEQATQEPSPAGV